MHRSGPRKSLTLLLSCAAALTLAGCSVFGGKAAEEVPYQVLRSDGDIELRQYPPILIAETRVAGSFDDATGPAFRRLFDYISGENRARQEIAMTAPVLREASAAGEGEEIAMTAPVFREASADGWTMAFVLPEGYSLESAPLPTDPEVEVRELPSERRAVIRFTGNPEEADIAEKSETLRAWMAKQELEAAGDPQLAGYNPPWTLPFMRRNEVLIPVR